MVSALLQLDILFERAGYAELAVRTWRTLIERCVGPDGSVVHSLLPRAGDFARGDLSGQLGDQAALTRACLDVAQYQPALASQALAIARRLADFAVQALRAPEGGFTTHLLTQTRKACCAYASNPSSITAPWLRRC